ncbi:MAG: GNAT family N-acetyltransferase [Acidimicrobiales bacterium]
MEQVRPAEGGDLARCGELLAEALERTAAQRGGELLVAAAVDPGGWSASDVVARWSADRRFRVLAGLIDDVVVGVAAGHLPGPDEPAGRIDCCYVEPAARQVGVGSALLAGLLDWFAGEGCADVDAAALPGDRSAKQLLESAGFKARLLVLHRRLG